MRLGLLGVLWGVLGVALAGCGSKRTRSTQPPPTIRHGTLQAGNATTRYGEVPKGVRLDHPLQVRLLKAARSAGGKRRGVHASPALTDAATRLAQATGGDSPDTEAIAFAASSAGLVAPVTQMLAFKAEGSTGRLGDKLAPHVAKAIKSGTANRIGVGIARDGKKTAVVVLLQGMHIQLGPIPRTLKVGEGFTLKGALKGAFSKPQIYLTDHTGAVTTLSSAKRGQAVSQRVQCKGKGEQRVEVMGTGPFGPTVLANLPFWCGLKPPTTHRIAVGGADTVNASVAARQLFAMVNNTRQQHGLKALRWHKKLARVAQAHSQDMRTNGFVGHVSPKTGGPGDRVRRAKVPVGRLLENVGVAPTVKGIHAGLMASPGHRAAILSKGTTQLGIGVIRRSRGKSADYFATELFAAPPAAVDGVAARERARKAVLQRVKKRRIDPGLNAVAQSVAADLARGALKSKDAQRVTQRRIRDRKIKVGALLAVMGQGPNPASIAKDKQIGRADLVRMGIGVAEGRRNGVPTLFSVVLLAK